MTQEDSPAEDWRINDQLARNRTLLATDRTVLAWLRTALALIGLGFALAQGYEYIEYGYAASTGLKLDPQHTPFYFGIGLLALGLFAALAGILQYRHSLKKILALDPEFTPPKSLALIANVLLLIIGTAGLVGILI